MCETSVLAPTFPPITFKSVPVLTSEMLAQAYEVDAKQIRQNFANNKDRFIEGKHFHSLSGKELKDFILCVENFDSQISSKTRVFTLWTERGAARHAKMLNSDKAWDVFEFLEETFFRVNKHAEPTPQSANAPLTPDQQCILRAIVDNKVYQVSSDISQRRGIYSKIWRGFKAHFRLAEYRQLPQSRMNEAIAFLLQFDAKMKKELPEETPKLPVTEKDKFEAYMEEVEAFRARTFTEIDRLLTMGLDLVDVYKFGPGGIIGFTPILLDWLKNVTGQPMPLVSDWQSMERAIEYSPLYLIKRLDGWQPDRRKQN